VADMAGFYYPRTSTGQASLLPAPPWYYSGDLLTVEYRTDPARVAALLPAPLALAPDDPGAVALIWADWQSCGVGGEELLDPVRSQYRECFAVVRCSFGGQVYSRCVFIWVDTDFAVARGLVQGYPKKLGSIHQTRPHPFGRAAPRIAPGGVFAGTLSAGGRRLAEAVVTLRSPCESNGFVNAHPMAHHRWMPSIVKGGGDSLAELVRSGSASVEAGPAWRGEARLELLASPTEELAELTVNEIISGYYRQVGVTWDGGSVLADLSGLSG
jgi:acetoacetate decarboxylase